MAAKINWRRYGTKLRHCHPVYASSNAQRSTYVQWSARIVNFLPFEVQRIRVCQRIDRDTSTGWPVECSRGRIGRWWKASVGNHSVCKRAVAIMDLFIHCRRAQHSNTSRAASHRCLSMNETSKSWQLDSSTLTRSSAIAEGPRDASCQLKSCQLPRNSAETTYTTSPDQIDVWSWRFSRRQCVIDNVHSTMTRWSRLPLSQVS